MREVVILSAVRTAGGKFGGALKDLSAPQLGALVAKEALRRSAVEGKEIDEVIFGNGWQAGVGPNTARIATVKSGLPHEVPAFTVNKRCGSSLKALALGAQAIRAWDADTVLVGGAESTSQVPYILPGARWGQRLGHGEMVDLIYRDGYMCPMALELMGATAETLAVKYAISREEQDAFALESQQKALRANREGAFREEILPVPLGDGKGEVFDTDENPREGLTLEKLLRLKPVFKKDGTVTAGNACTQADAASALILMAAEKARALGLRPLARVRGYASAGVDPALMGLGPVPAIPRALEKAGLKLSDIDLIELNEAFAAQVLAVERELKWDRQRLNVHGGAIALGHPVGATGAKLTTTLLHALKARDQTMGLVSLCIGGGQGIALVLERLN